MITVAGAGAFGTALAVSLATSGQAVQLWSRNQDHAKVMRQSRKNSDRLPGVTLPETIEIITDLRAAAHPVLLAIPMQQLRAMVAANSEALQNRPLVACCKGVELTSGLGPTALLTSMVPSAAAAILSGPSFAHDIARGLPTALTLACADAAIGETLQHAVTTANLRIYRTTDTIGAELGGALKNVIAIAAGAVIGAGLGESARAALMTRGYAEMQRMALRLGAQSDTLAGLSGFGDLTLTCTSSQSRNYHFGLALGLSEPFDPSITVEGAATARAALIRANALNLEMPITQAVVGLLNGDMDLRVAIDKLLSRPLKEE